MADDVERLITLFEANISQYERSMQKIVQRTERTGRRVEARFKRTDTVMGQIFDKIGRRGAAAFAAIASGAAVMSFSRQIQESLQLAENISDLARQANASTEALQELRFVVDKNGGSADLLDRGLRRLSSVMGDVLRGEVNEQAEAIRDLDLEQGILNGSIETSDQLFRALSARLQDVETQAQRTSLVADILGARMGEELAQSLSLTQEEMTGFITQARELGVVLSDDIVQQGAAANVELRTMRDQFDAQNNRAILENAEALRGVAGALGQISAAAITATAEFATFVDSLNTDFESFQLDAARSIQDLMIDAITLRQSMFEGLTFPLPQQPILGPGGAYAFSPGTSQTGLTPFERRVRENRRIQQEHLAFMGDTSASEPDVVTLTPPGDVSRPATGSEALVSPRIAPRAAREARLQQEREIAELAAQTKAKFEADALIEAIRQNRQDFAEAFGDAFAGGVMAAFDGNLQDFLKQKLRQAMFNALSEAFERVGQRVFDGLSNNGGTTLATAVGSIFGGKRATGGPVRPNVPYMIGENGPETFVPNSAGVIKPTANAIARSSVSINNSTVINAGDGVDEAAIISYVDRGNRQLRSDLQAQLTALPGRLSRAQKLNDGRFVT